MSMRSITELECLCVMHALELAKEELLMYESDPDYTATSGVEDEIHDALVILTALVDK